jgi:hypothetical protein
MNMKRLAALFLIVLAVAAFATTASAKVRGELIFGMDRSGFAQGHQVQ